MSGGKITDQQISKSANQQIRIYMNERKSRKTQIQAAVKANLSVRSGRRIDILIANRFPNKLVV
ncbi:hypothetical protein MNBD_GAMMA16-560 [hydrothermal vent metagenome]|uniref:Uncharacterized protein n=1 Tax=hydrothermal vent metagenome TaxID=652676 RepID=A0A3B0Z9X7_9ZZZZ